MTKKMKFHMMAISIISVIIIVLYLLIGPKPQPVQAGPTGRYARISNATWGMGCNPQIEEALQTRGATALAKDADGKVIQAEPLKKVTADNVLPVIKKACEGQAHCELLAIDDVMGVTLLPGCYRQLNVNYRCSETDRLVTVNIDQGRMLQIDCSADAAAPAPTHP